MINLIDGIGKKTLGIARKDMPQIAHKDIPQFIKELKVDATKKSISANKLSPTQDEINSHKVDKIDCKDIGKKPIIVSKDGHILDGHHQWAKAMVTDHKKKLNCIHINMPIKKLINKANEFGKVEHRDIMEKAAQAAFIDELQKIAFHPLVELGMLGSEAGAILGSATGIPFHKNKSLKNSMLEKAEMGSVMGATIMPITAKFLQMAKLIKL